MRTTWLLLIGSLCFCSCAVNSQNIAFPGAEGFGRFATGGRGGKVIAVTNLNDDGPGSLRDAIQEKYPRIIVFTVSGNIALESPLDINYGNVTIAGQTAPGDGICIRNFTTNIKADNVIIRFLRFRMGDEKRFEGDAISGTRGKENIIIDHCSISWATDECASFYHNRNFTMQWCIVSESLNRSVHAKGEHGYGGIWGGEGASFHHNLIANHKSRLPRFSGSASTPNGPDELVDFRNNVIYNWQDNNSYGGERGRYNVVNNYYKPGPSTKKSASGRLLNPWSPYGQFFLLGNYLDGNAAVTGENSLGVHAEAKDSALVAKEFNVAPVSLHKPERSYELVLTHAGASLRRDAVDRRVIEEVRKGSSASGRNRNGIIDSQQDVGGWPKLVSHTVLPDKDGDGMPDAWEKANNLNPEDPGDSVEKSADSYYSNIEVYINSLVKGVVEMR